MATNLIKIKFIKVAIALWEKQPTEIGVSFYVTGCIGVWRYPDEAVIIAEYRNHYGDRNLKELNKLKHFYKEHCND